MQRSDTIRLRDSFFDRFCRILLSFFFLLLSRGTCNIVCKKKKKMYRIFIHSPGKYFKSTNIATFLFHYLSDIYIRVEFDKKKIIAIFFICIFAKTNTKIGISIESAGRIYFQLFIINLSINLCFEI